MSRRKPIVFRYALAAGRLSPMISAGFCVKGRWHVAELYVDSGAFYTLLQATHAVAFGLNFRQGRKVLAQVGDGSLIPVYLHNLRMQIGTTQFEAPVGFSEKLGVRFSLLGRQGVFDRFRICFDERRRVVTFQPV